MERAARGADDGAMTNDCPLLRELDAWFSLALDLLATQPDVRRDVLLLLGGPGRAADVAHVTRSDAEESAGYVVVYPPTSPHLSLPLTRAFVEATGLYPHAWPERRDSPVADAVAVEEAIATVDAALARLTGTFRPAGADRLIALRMHAWRHELGGHVTVLARYYGAELASLLKGSLPCPGLRTDTAHLVPMQRQVTSIGVA